MCVCVCVCVCQGGRERERERLLQIQRDEAPPRVDARFNSVPFRISSLWRLILVSDLDDPIKHVRGGSRILCVLRTWVVIFTFAKKSPVSYTRTQKGGQKYARKGVSELYTYTKGGRSTDLRGALLDHPHHHPRPRRLHHLCCG